MRKNNEIKIWDTPVDLFNAAAAEFARLAIDTVDKKGQFTVVLSGGSTAKHFFDILAKYDEKKIPWNRIQFFFSDERYVPVNDLENNYHIAYTHLFSKVAVPMENIHRMQTEFPETKSAAEHYEQLLRDFFHNQNGSLKFDLVYLGLGDDAHTASLMPFSDVVNGYAHHKENDQLVVSLWVPHLNMYRLTLTPNAINNSEKIIFLVTGINKAFAVHEVLNGPSLPEQYPGQLIHCVHGKTIWYLDQAAAGKLTSIDVR